MTTTTAPASQTYHVFIRATPQQIWHALTRPEHSTAYLFGALVETTGVPGTPFRYHSPDRTTLWGDDTVLDAAPPYRLVVSYRGLYNPDLASEPPSRVTWQIEPDQHCVCLLTVVHDPARARPEDRATRRRHRMDAGAQRTQNAARNRRGTQHLADHTRRGASAPNSERNVMKTRIQLDQQRFGPWAMVTGASSGIGRAVAAQLAANGINLVLAARRLSMLDEVGRELGRQYHIQHRSVRVDLAGPDFLNTLIDATNDLDLGLVVSNAGDMNLGELLATPYDALLAELRVNTEAHLSLTHHFGQVLARRGRGGILLVSSLAGIQGVPYIANYSAAKSYVLSLGEAVHRELSPRGVTVTVLVPGATTTAMTARFGADKTAMGRLMMSADACAIDGLAALAANRAVRISGRMNRATVALTPRRTRIRVFGAMNRSMADQITHGVQPAHTPGIVLDDRPV